MQRLWKNLRPITCQSTRTHNCRKRLRRMCWWSGHFYVVWHWRRMHSLSKAIVRCACPVSAGGASRVSLRATDFYFSGGGASSLGRVGAPAPMRVSVGQSRRVPAGGRGASGLVRLHSFGVGAQPGLRQSGAMPPFPVQHPLRKVRAGVLGWLALATSASYNRSAHTDSQRQEAASRHVLCAGGLQRCTALASHA